MRFTSEKWITEIYNLIFIIDKDSKGTSEAEENLFTN